MIRALVLHELEGGTQNWPCELYLLTSTAAYTCSAVYNMEGVSCRMVEMCDLGKHGMSSGGCWHIGKSPVSGLAQVKACCCLCTLLQDIASNLTSNLHGLLAFCLCAKHQCYASDKECKGLQCMPHDAYPSMLQNTMTTLLNVSFWPVATIRAASGAPGASKYPSRAQDARGFSNMLTHIGYCNIADTGMREKSCCASNAAGCLESSACANGQCAQGDKACKH